MIYFLVVAISGCWESFWRRWFGGGFSGTKIGNNRGVQHVCNCIFLALLFYYKFDNEISVEKYLWLSIVFMTALWQVEFWTRGHGPMFDMGRDGLPDEKLEERYEAMWFNHYFVSPLYDHFHWTKYKFSYDSLSMAIRYTYPCVWLYPFYGYKIWFVGLLISPTYAWCWSFKEYDNPRYGSTQMAEWVAGAIVGVGLSAIKPTGFILQYFQ